MNCGHPCVRLLERQDSRRSIGSGASMGKDSVGVMAMTGNAGGGWLCSSRAQSAVVSPSSAGRELGWCYSSTAVTLLERRAAGRSKD
jgi:hypothetical protein